MPERKPQEEGMRAPKGGIWKGVLCILLAFAVLGRSGETDAVREAQRERAEAAKELREALKAAKSPQERAELAAAYVRQDQAKSERVAERIEEKKPAATPTIEERVKGVADAERKAALKEKYRLTDELVQMKKATEALAPEERARRYAQWQEQNAPRLEALAEELKPEEKIGKKSVAEAEAPERLSEEGKAAWKKRRSLLADLDELRERTKDQAPQERAAAYRQWQEQNAPKLEAAARELEKALK